MNDLDNVSGDNTSYTKNHVLLQQRCVKALWLAHHQPQLAAPPTNAEQLRFEHGNAVDEKARDAYPGGFHVDEVEWALAKEKTQQRIGEGATRLYQSAFAYEGLRIRPDILDIHSDGSVTIYEVKMSTRVKPEHKQDVAIQVYVLQQAGFRVRRTALVLINTLYTASNEHNLFKEEDITDRIWELLDALTPVIQSVPSTIALETQPTARVGKHCKRVRTCSFYEHCWQDLSEPSVVSIPRLSDQKLNALLDQGIWDLQDVPDNFDLTATQRKYITQKLNPTRSVHSNGLANALAAFTYPLHFLDFETYASPLPLFEGIKPYQSIPFQFSVHIMEEDGNVHHREYLHTDMDDPRTHLIDHLLEAIEETGTVLAYHAPFEKRILNELADAFPAHALHLAQIESRIIDQLVLLRQYVHLPEFNGSYSLKTVTRVLLAGIISYDNLEIGAGDAAQAAWLRMRESDHPEKEQLQQALRKYCTVDTQTMVEIHRWCKTQSGY